MLEILQDFSRFLEIFNELNIGFFKEFLEAFFKDFYEGV